MISAPDLSFLPIFLASLIGSPHCAGMCGGFVALYSCNSKKPLGSHLAYHFGRLVTYSLLGALAGLLGSRLDNLGLIIGLQRISTILVGLMLIVWGVLKLFPTSHNIAPRLVWLKGIRTPLHYLLSKKSTMPPALFALLVGSCTTFLPCGWLYLFVSVAAASGSWINGVYVMAVFWLGTVPILSATGFLTQFVARLGSHAAPRITAGLIIAAGIFSLSGHLEFLPFHSHDHHHHHAAP